MNKKNLTQLPENSEKGYQKVLERIEEGNVLLGRQIGSDEELEEAEVLSNNWSEHNQMILSLLFDDSLIADKYAKLYHNVTPRPSYDSQSLIHEHPRLKEQILQSHVRQYRKQITMQIKYLQRIGDQLELLDEPPFTVPSLFGDDVFIVHGHDEGSKYAVARFVENLGLPVTVLEDHLHGGLTPIEKFEKYADNAGFAIVLLTPDDMETSRYELVQRPIAHQNVIFELGYFIGKLGYERVCPLFRGEVEIPSDSHGIAYVHMDNNDDWKLKLTQEMKNVGLPVDMNKLF